MSINPSSAANRTFSGNLCVKVRRRRSSRVVGVGGGVVVVVVVVAKVLSLELVVLGGTRRRRGRGRERRTREDGWLCLAGFSLVSDWFLVSDLFLNLRWDLRQLEKRRQKFPASGVAWNGGRSSIGKKEERSCHDAHLMSGSHHSRLPGKRWASKLRKGK